MQFFLTKTFIQNFFNLVSENKIGGQLDIFHLKFVTGTQFAARSIGVITGFAIANPNKNLDNCWRCRNRGRINLGVNFLFPRKK